MFTNDDIVLIRNWILSQNDEIPDRPIEFNTLAKQFYNSAYDAHTYSVLTAYVSGSKILVNKLPPTALKAMAHSGGLAAFQTGDQDLISKWVILGNWACGYNEILKGNDPTLLAVKNLALSDGVLTQDIIDFYTAKVGTRIEVILNKDLTNDAVSIPKFSIDQLR